MVNTVYGTHNSFHNPSIAISQSGDWDSKLGLLNGAGNFPLTTLSSGFFGNGANYQNGWNFSPLGSQFNDHYSGNTFVYSDNSSVQHERVFLSAARDYGRKRPLLAV